MIRQVFWKEWHEHRSKYLGYWLTLHAPMVLLVLAIALTSGARVPFADLSNALVLKYLPLSLGQAFFVLTIFLILTGYLAVATFSPEIEDKSLFFLYEQGLTRRRYLAIKLLHGSLHVVLATFLSIVLMTVACYLMMLISGKVTWAGSSGAFGIVMSTAFRAATWCALISLAAFTASALIASLVPKWWIASLCSVVMSILFVGWGEDKFSFLPDMPNDSMSIGFGLGTNNTQWINISRAFKPEELNAMALWWMMPLLSTVLLIIIFTTATTWLYSRRELR